MPAIVLAIVGWLISALRQYLPGIVGRILLALGIGFATQQLVLPSLLGIAQSIIGTLPSRALAYYSALGCDIEISIVLSAIAAGRVQSVLLRRIGGAA